MELDLKKAYERSIELAKAPKENEPGAMPDSQRRFPSTSDLPNFGDDGMLTESKISNVRALFLGVVRRAAAQVSAVVHNARAVVLSADRVGAAGKERGDGEERQNRKNSFHFQSP